MGCSGRPVGQRAVFGRALVGLCFCALVFAHPAGAVPDRAELSQKVGAISEARLGRMLDLMAEVPFALPFVTRFREMVRRGEVQVLPLTEEARAKLPARLRNATNLVSCYDFRTPDGKVERSLLLLDVNLELGEAIEALFHEIVHATDHRLKAQGFRLVELLRQWNEAWQEQVVAAMRLGIAVDAIHSRDFEPKARERLESIAGEYRGIEAQSRLDGEARAHRRTARFLKEFTARFPKTGEYFDAPGKTSTILPGDEKRTREKIADRYGYPLSCGGLLETSGGTGDETPR